MDAKLTIKEGKTLNFFHCSAIYHLSDQTTIQLEAVDPDPTLTKSSQKSSKKHNFTKT